MSSLQVAYVATTQFRSNKIRAAAIEAGGLTQVRAIGPQTINLFANGQRSAVRRTWRGSDCKMTTSAKRGNREGDLLCASSATQASSEKTDMPRVVIIDEGFGALDCANALAQARVEVTLSAVMLGYLLVAFEQRVLVTIQWLWRYVTFQRGARLITGAVHGSPAASRSREEQGR